MELNLPPDRSYYRTYLGVGRPTRVPTKPLEEQKGNKMGYALWCDQHGGPFSPKDPDMQEYSKKGKVGDNSYDVETFTLCGPCANGFQVGQPSATALEAKIEMAERDLGMRD